jgi:serine/threonine protein phosphatase PrpC
MTFKSSAATHVGMVRKLNEDSMLEMPEAGVWIVADGMGGHSAGDVASQTITGLVSQIEPLEDFEDLLDDVKLRIQDANTRLIAQYSDVDQNRSPGSTVVALMIKGNQGAIVWAGDSRIYRYRDHQLVQLTRDHSHVQDLVDQNMIKQQDAESHPMANVITRAVGIFDYVELDSIRFSVEPNDQFILCSDGLSRLASSEEIAETIEQSDNFSDQLVETLINMALDRGAPDNVTVICVRTPGEGVSLSDTGETAIMSSFSPAD